MKKIIYLLLAVFLMAAASRSQAQIQQRSINDYEIDMPTIKLPLVVPTPNSPEQLRIRYYPQWNIYYDSELREWRTFECLVIESTTFIHNTPTYMLIKVNGTVQDWPFFASRVYLLACDGNEYEFEALIPSNHDVDANKKYSPLNEVDGGLIFDFDF